MDANGLFHGQLAEQIDALLIHLMGQVNGRSAFPLRR